VNDQGDGTKRINIRFTPKEECSLQQCNQARGQQRQPREFRGRAPADLDDMDDDIPF